MHEDHSTRPMTDAELETVVGGATTDNAAVLGFYEDKSSWITSGGSDPSYDIATPLLARSLDAQSEVILSLVDSIPIPPESPDGITDDQEAPILPAGK